MYSLVEIGVNNTISIIHINTISITNSTVD